jgi:hypothetical protein
MEASTLETEVDCISAEAESQQLRARNHAVAALHEGRNRAVGTTRATFAVYMPVNVARVSHPAILAADR